jgi:hypothetical protein
MAIIMALWFQYSVGPSIVNQEGWVWKTYRAIPGSGKMVYNAWHDSCEEYADQPDLLNQCAGNAGAYRPTFLAAIYFSTNAIATRIVPSLNREAWPAKYALFFFGLLISMFIPSYPLFTGFFLWMARLGAAVFVVIQQVILIDVAYNWNDDWVDRANQADRMSYGSGSGWLQAIVGTCVGFYSASIVVIALLYKFFANDCPANTWIITLTLLAIIAMTAIQLSGDEGSLLTSAVLSLYATYLCWSTVAKNPSHQCNPSLGSNDMSGIIIGLLITIISLAWTGWSWSAEERLTIDSLQSAKAVTPASAGSQQLNLDVPFLDPDDQPTTGLVTEQSADSTMDNTTSVHVWKLNVVMALISCYVAMILTGWGTIEWLDEHSNAANPTVGRINMVIIGVSQWLAIGLYIWTLVAARLFPDREFS